MDVGTGGLIESRVRKLGMRNSITQKSDILTKTLGTRLETISERKMMVHEFSMRFSFV